MKMNILLNNRWIKGKKLRETTKYFGLNENKNTTYPNLWDAAKTVLGGKVIAVNVYISKKNI